MAVRRHTPNDYLNFFDAEIYAKFSFSGISPNSKKDWFRVFFLDSFSKIFQEGGISGKCLLDVGSGPGISSVISACKHFENVYLSDLVPQNREYLYKWLQEADGAHDFSSILKYVAEKENPRESWIQRQTELRDKIKALLPCDVTQDNPLTPNLFAQFDTVTSSQCLESASYDLPSYQKVSYNVSQLIKPGGWLVIGANLGYQSYSFSDTVFRSAPTTLEDVQQTWEKLGFEIRTMEKYILTTEEKDVLLKREAAEKETIQGVCVMAARKNLET